VDPLDNATSSDSLKTEAEPASETSCFIKKSDYGQSKKKKKFRAESLGSSTKTYHQAKLEYQRKIIM
jgi:hypothetical protein